LLELFKNIKLKKLLLENIKLKKLLLEKKVKFSLFQKKFKSIALKKIFVFSKNKEFTKKFSFNKLE